ncbi:MAG: alpha/beta hydrolase [Myxococcota bacterium]
MLRMFLNLQVGLWTTVWRRLLGRSPRQGWPFVVDAATTYLGRDFNHLASLPPPLMRREYEKRAQATPATRQVRVMTVDVGGVSCAQVDPPEREGDRTVLYLHGGAYVFGSTRTHADVLARVALGARARVLAPDYRQAPAHPYPAQLDDALAVYQAILAHTPSTRVTVAGESAGGHLALALVMACRDRGLPQPAGAMLASAWLDLTGSRPSVVANDAQDWGDVTHLTAYAHMFAGTIPLEDPRISLLNGELGRLPPLLVVVGASERLRDENAELVDKVRVAGGVAELHQVERCAHSPVFFAQYSPDAAAAMAHLTTWMRERTPVG